MSSIQSVFQQSGRCDQKDYYNEDVNRRSNKSKDAGYDTTDSFLDDGGADYILLGASEPSISPSTLTAPLGSSPPGRLFS